MLWGSSGKKAEEGCAVNIPWSLEEQVSRGPGSVSQSFFYLGRLLGTVPVCCPSKWQVRRVNIVVTSAWNWPSSNGTDSAELWKHRAAGCCQHKAGNWTNSFLQAIIIPRFSKGALANPSRVKHKITLLIKQPYPLGSINFSSWQRLYRYVQNLLVWCLFQEKLS